MEREACHWSQTQTQTQMKNPKMSQTVTPINNGNCKLKMKTELCRRFRQGVCAFGSKCKYAHGVGELRPSTFQEPQLCRMFFQNKHCPYGHTCRFLHPRPGYGIGKNVDSPNLEIKGHCPFGNFSHTQLQPEQGKCDGYTSTEHRVMQTSTAATNASTNTVATSSLQKNEPYRVKSIFKKNELQKISRIYADWI